MTGLHPQAPVLRIGHLPGPPAAYAASHQPKRDLLSRLLGGGQPLKDGRESSIEHAYPRRAQLAPGPLVQWLVGVHDSRDFEVLKQFRDGFTHRQVNRRLSVLLSQPTVFRYESEVGTSTQTAGELLGIAAPFAVEQFSAFCDAVHQFKR